MPIFVVEAIFTISEPYFYDAAKKLQVIQNKTRVLEHDHRGNTIIHFMASIMRLKIKILLYTFVLFEIFRLIYISSRTIIFNHLVSIEVFKESNSTTEKSMYVASQWQSRTALCISSYLRFVLAIRIQ